MNNAQWAKNTFGQADLGDPRRTTRLVKLVKTLEVVDLCMKSSRHSNEV